MNLNNLTKEGNQAAQGLVTYLLQGRSHVIVNKEDLFKVLEYLFIAERKDYYTELEDLKDGENMDSHIFHPLMRMVVATYYLEEKEKANDET